MTDIQPVVLCGEPLGNGPATCQLFRGHSGYHEWQERDFDYLETALEAEAATPDAGLRAALEWALDIIDVYDQRMTALGEPRPKTWEAGMAKARAALAGAGDSGMDAATLAEAWERHRDAYYTPGDIIWHSCSPLCAPLIIDTIRELASGGER
jgi:hypothetical protein